MSNFLIFIPCYQCQDQIGRVIEKVKSSGIAGTILIIDNKSTDRTIENAKQALNQLSLPGIILRNEINCSLGGSHKVAFNFALENDFTHLIALHGDDQADINDLIPYLKSETYLKYDCLLGSRFHSGSKLIGYSKFRIFGNLILNQFCSLVCKENITDMGSGLNMYSRKFLEDKRYLCFPNDLTFNVFLLFHSYINAYRTTFFPISWREEDQISNAKLFRQMKKIFNTILKVLNQKETLYFSKASVFKSEVIYKK